MDSGWESVVEARTSGSCISHTRSSLNAVAIRAVISISNPENGIAALQPATAVQICRTHAAPTEHTQSDVE